MKVALYLFCEQTQDGGFIQRFSFLSISASDAPTPINLWLTPRFGWMRVSPFVLRAEEG